MTNPWPVLSSQFQTERLDLRSWVKAAHARSPHRNPHHVQGDGPLHPRTGQRQAHAPSHHLRLDSFTGHLQFRAYARRLSCAGASLIYGVTDPVGSSAAAEVIPAHSPDRESQAHLVIVWRTPAFGTT